MTQIWELAVRVKKSVSRFIRHCYQTRSASTAKSYQDCLVKLVRLHGSRKVENLTRFHIEGFFAAASVGRNGRVLAPDTIRLSMTAFEQFQKFLKEFGIRKRLIVKGIKKPKGRRRERIPTAEENAAILAVSKPEFRRVFRSLRMSGARPGELAAATIADWDRDQGLIVLWEHKAGRKTGRSRKIGVGPKLAEVLLETIGSRVSGRIFVKRNGNHWTTKELSATYRRYRDKQKLSEELCLYLTRHEFAMQMVEKVGIYALSELLGHSSVKTTEHYLKRLGVKLAEHQSLFEE